MPNHNRPRYRQRPTPPYEKMGREEGVPRGSNQKRPRPSSRQERERRREEWLRSTGGPFRSSYQTGLHPDRDRPDPRDNDRPWQRGMDENNWVNWEDEEPERPGGWERTERFREYPAESSVNYAPGYRPNEHRSPDQDIRDDIYELLSQNPYILASDIRVRVRDGYVLLEGFVLDRRLKQMAGSIAWSVQGVRGVENRLNPGP